MAVQPNHEISYEDLLNNYEYKVSKKVILREYPWIKDMFINEPNEVNKYNLIFVDFLIDPYMLGREMDWQTTSYLDRQVNNKDGYWSPYLSSFFKIPYEEGKPLQDEINDTLEAINKSAALPTELRLPSARKIQIGAFFANQSSITPQDNPSSPQ
jgi:hypothetical protein